MTELKTLESYIVSLTMKGPSAAEQRDAEKAFKALSGAVELFVPVAAAAGGALLAVTDHLAGGLSSLYYEAQRVGTTVERLKAAQYAGVQAGSSVAVISGDLKKVFDALTLTPDIKDTLKKQFGLTNEDFKDTVEVLRKIDEALNRGFHGTNEQRSEAEARRLQLGLSLENVLAAGRPQWKQAFDEQIVRGKGLNSASVKARDLTISLNRLHASIANVFDKAGAEIFADYGITLDDVSDWIDDNQPMLIGMAKDTVAELHKSWEDISYVGGPVIHVMRLGFDDLSTRLDKLLGHPDGKHGGVYGLHYALDALAIYIAGSFLWKVVAALGIPLSRLGLGAVGVGAIGATIMPQPLNEGEDEPYRQAHPGWHPGMPKEQTGPQKSTGAQGFGPFSAEQSTSAGRDLNSPSGVGSGGGDSSAQHPRYYHGTLQVGNETFHYGTGAPDRGRGSSAFGDHLITGWDPAAHHGVGGGAFRIEDQDDPNVPGGPREQVEIHEGRSEDLDHLYTAGCFAVPPSEWPRARAAIMRQLRDGSKILRIENDGNASVVPVGSPRPQSRLQLQHDLHSKLAALTGHKPIVARSARINNLGTRKQVTNIQVASTDPHSSASEIARHMKAIHAGTLRSLDRLA